MELWKAAARDDAAAIANYLAIADSFYLYYDPIEETNAIDIAVQRKNIGILWMLCRHPDAFSYALASIAQGPNTRGEEFMDIGRWLLKRGANPKRNLKPHGATPLHAALVCDNMPAFKLMAPEDMDINDVFNATGLTLAMCACARLSSEEDVLYVLERCYRPYLNRKTGDSDVSALSIALDSKKGSIVKYLLKRGVTIQKNLIPTLLMEYPMETIQSLRDQHLSLADVTAEALRQENAVALGALKDQLVERPMEVTLAMGDDAEKCLVCRTEDARVMLYPCRHLCACEECSIDVKICPICAHVVHKRRKF